VRIAVIGGSGRIGSRIVGEARSREHEVTAVVRDRSRIDPGAGGDGRISVASADAFEPAAVAAAVADADVVVSAVGHAASLDDQSFYVRAAKSLVEALRSLGGEGKRLIAVGGFGSLEVSPGVQFADRSTLPDKAAPEIKGQRDALSYYRSVQDVCWTYVSPPPGGIRPGERTGSYRLTRDGVFEGEPRESLISMEDFAVAVVDEAERGEHPLTCIAIASQGPYSRRPVSSGPAPRPR
jgi:putative NADH-flavin reductase